MHATPPSHRLLVIANETCAGPELFEAMRERADGPDSEVLIVFPALSSRLRYWMSDEDPGIEAAERRLAASLERCSAAGVVARGALGDADPLQALDDGVRSFSPTEVIVATHPEGRSNWLEQGLVAQARERFDVPITHLVVDAAHDEAQLVERESVDPAAPARERHTVARSRAARRRRAARDPRQPDLVHLLRGRRPGRGSSGRGS